MKTNGFSLIFRVLERFRLPRITKKSKKIEVSILRGQKIPKMATWVAKNAILQRKLEPRGRFWRPKTTQTRQELKFFFYVLGF